MREYAIPELAMARETHPATTRALIADALDLQHRLPRTWAIVAAGECQPWVARKVAVIARGLAFDAVGLVDRAVARAIAGGERERSRHERYVSISRADQFGYRHIIARVAAGVGAWIDAMVDRVADILALTHGHDHNHDELRSLAMGGLARPADLLRLLLEHTDLDTGLDDHLDSDERPAWAPDHLRDTVDRLSALPAKRLASLRGRGCSRGWVRPPATCFMALSEAARPTRLEVSAGSGPA